MMLSGFMFNLASYKKLCRIVCYATFESEGVKIPTH